MAPTVLDGVATNETTTLRWVEDIADPTAIDLSTEYNAGTSVPLECLLTEQFNPDASVTTAELRRMCSNEVRQRPGAVTRTIADLVGVYDPQDLSAAVSKAYVALAPGAEGYLVVRRGIHVDTPAADGDVVDVYKVQISYRTKIQAADNDEHQFRAGITVQNYWEDVVIGGES